MPFVPQEQWERLQADNVHMAGELAHYRAISGVMGLALVLQAEIADRLENPSLTPSQIADEAYMSVLHASVNEARKQLITEYQEAHRADLYKKAVDEVRKTEGDNLLQSTREKIESNPELMLELRDSARKELAARAIDLVKGEISAEQEVIISAEADRQLALDRFDVEFAVEGELDLFRDDVNELLMPGDTMVLTYADERNSAKRMTVKWMSDAKNQFGWVYDSAQDYFYNRSGMRMEFPKDKFLYIGSVQADMVRGKEVPVQNVLKKDAPILFEQDAKKGEYTRIEVYTGDGYRTIRDLPVLRAIDLRTRTLVF